MSRKNRLILILLGLFLLVAGCKPEGLLPGELTPIPTLVPATALSEESESTATPAYSNLSFPASQPSAEEGEALYQEMCASCHGEDGEGTVPQARNFSDQDYMRGETPVSFYVAVTEGRGDMPGFRSEMSSDERWDVVYYVWQFSTNRENLQEGQEIYDAYCESCHGPGGQNEEMGAVDFTDVRLVSRFAPRDHYLIITQGKGSMPAFQSRLTQDERWAVIDFLIAFAYETSLIEEGQAAAEPTATVAGICTGEDVELTNPYAWDDGEAIAAGQSIYDDSCASCHGEDGTGNLSNTDDLTTHEKRESFLSDSATYYCIISEGEGAMPGWKDTLSEERIWQVLTYIASLGE